MTRFLRNAAAIGAIAALALTAGCGSINDVDTPGGSKAPSADGAAFETDWASSTFEVAPTTVDGDTVSIDVGNGFTVTQDKTEPIKIAFLNQGSTNSYLQANIAGAEARAKELGVELTIFDGGFDSQTQYSQIQNALTSGGYNAFMTLAVDGSATCKLFTEEAPAKNILSAVIIQPICGLDVERGLDVWAPGTLTSIVGGGTVEFYDQWAEGIAASLTEPTQVIYITGPEGLGPVMSASAALATAAEKYPNLQLVDTQYTDFSAAGALSATQNSLLAHPEVTLVLSHFTDMTTGVIQALEQSGKSDQVRVFDIGGNEISVGYVKDGKIEQTVPYFPATAAACAVDMLVAAHGGEAVPRVVLNDCRPTEGGNGTQTLITVDASNVADFVPEY